MNGRPTRERIDELLNVDTETGVITWRKGRGRAGAGSVAGRLHVTGYLELQVDGVMLKAHAVVFFVAHGWWPDRIDHINGVRCDNRISNLREADAAANARNRTNWVTERGLLGANKTSSGRWSSTISADSVSYHLGVYDSEQEAHAAYVEARDLCAIAERNARHSVLTKLRLKALVNSVTRDKAAA